MKPIPVHPKFKMFDTIEQAVIHYHTAFADMEAEHVVSWHFLEPADKPQALEFIRGDLEIKLADGFYGYSADDPEEIYTAWVTYAFAIGEIDELIDRSTHNTGSPSQPH